MKKHTILVGVVGFVVIGLCATVTRAEPPKWAGEVTRYLETFKRADGGYAWLDQEESHVTPTWAVVGTYHALGIEVPEKGKLAAWVREHHPLKNRRPERELHEFEQQQIETLVWLGEDAKGFEGKVKGWTRPVEYMKRYEQHGWPVLQQEVTAVLCREMLGMSTKDAEAAFAPYLDERRRADGSYNSTPASAGGDGHVVNTWLALRTLKALGREPLMREQTVGWLQSCQQSDGGFLYQPDAKIGRVEDVWYAWGAVRGLKMLGMIPKDRDGCVKFLHSLYNGDGGFGDRVGWPSNPLATFYAVDSLATVGALGDALSGQKEVAERAAEIPADMKVWTIQIEAHGAGSAADAVELARGLHIHLWGCKNSKDGWIERAQQIADREKVPVKFFIADEEYGTFTDIPGFGTYSHMSDLVVPAGVDYGPNLAGKAVTTWEEFRQRRIVPLEKAQGRMVWQFGENEPLVRALLDDSVEKGLGYAAISTYHFGNPDFVTSQPFLWHYRYKLPLIGLQDAHGNESWFWGPLVGFRTVFVAKEPTWEAWLGAMKKRWVVAVRHDGVTEFATKMHGGAPGVQEFVKQHAKQWQWWDNPDIHQPAVSVVAIKPGDQGEEGRPEKGTAIRVRCAWEGSNTDQAKKKLVELVSLSVDGKKVDPKLVQKRPGKKGVVAADSYYLYAMEEAGGKHTATAVVRWIEGGREESKTIEFGG